MCPCSQNDGYVILRYCYSHDKLVNYVCTFKYGLLTNCEVKMVVYIGQVLLLELRSINME